MCHVYSTTAIPLLVLIRAIILDALVYFLLMYAIAALCGLYVFPFIGYSEGAALPSTDMLETAALSSLALTVLELYEKRRVA